jgi:hypothetical protein
LPGFEDRPPGIAVVLRSEPEITTDAIPSAVGLWGERVGEACVDLHTRRDATLEEVVERHCPLGGLLRLLAVSGGNP